ncbi:MAG: DinB family protein [Anaerolineae bacterium]|nr:DinB family protein [Anaerolineae bacterium]MCI0609685.1 DinB family protein [Anaerolineae bacterium]
MTIEQDFATNLHQFMGETFENPIGIYLDPNTSLFQTLETISAEEASIPVGGKCASLAAQVAHVTFYIESFERYALEGDNSPRDWSYIWRTVEKVTAEEWEGYKRKLREAYQRMDKLFHENKLWNEDTIGGALSIVVHTAYHLGEIRQALCTLK